MSVLITILFVVLALVCVLLVGVVLIQDSKAGGLSAAFGAGGGETLLGAHGQKDITRFTAIVAVIFLGLCVLLGVLSRAHEKSSSVKSPIGLQTIFPPGSLPGGEAPLPAGAVVAPPSGAATGGDGTTTTRPGQSGG